MQLMGMRGPGVYGGIYGFEFYLPGEGLPHSLQPPLSGFDKPRAERRHAGPTDDSARIEQHVAQVV